MTDELQELLELLFATKKLKTTSILGELNWDIISAQSVLLFIRNILTIFTLEPIKEFGRKAL